MSKDTQQEIASQVEAKENRATPEKRGKWRGKHSAAARIATTATFTAIAVICKLIGKTLMLTPSFTVSFIYIPWLIAGATLGPIGGMAVGLSSDLLGNIILGAGTSINPLTIVSNTLFPLPIALIFKLHKGGNVYVKTICGALISLAVCTLGVGSFALYWFYGYIDTLSFPEYIGLYRLPQIAVLAINIAALCMLVRPLQKAGLYPVGEGGGDGRLMLAFGTIVSYALFAAALIAVTVSNTGSAPVYVILSAVYLLLNMFMIGVHVHGEFKTVLIICEVLAALTIALTATIASGDVQVWLKYILSAAAIAAAVGFTAALLVARRKRRARRK